MRSSRRPAAAGSVRPAPRAAFASVRTAGLGLLLTAGLGLPLGGCALERDSLPGLSFLPKSWLESSPPAGSSSAAAENAADPADRATAAGPRWWMGFASPTLNRLEGQAQAANSDLKIAIARVRQADAAARIAGAPLLPSLDLAVGADRQKTSANGSSSKKSLVGNEFKTTLSVGYELDFWGKVAAAADSAQAAATASRFDRRSAALTVESGVASGYLSLLGTRARRAAAEETRDIAELILSATRDRFAAGLATSLDIAQQESQLASARAALPGLEQQERQAIYALALLCGVAPAEFDGGRETLDQLTNPAFAAPVPSGVLLARPDLRAAEAQLTAAQADIVVARAALFPSLSLSLSAGVQSGDVSTLLQPGSQLLSLGGSLTQAIFHHDALSAAVDQKRAKRDELVETYRKTILTALTDVESALVARRQTALTLQAARAAEAAARQALDIATDQQKRGTIDIITLLNTQKTWAAAQDSRIQAQQAALTATVTLIKAIGGGAQDQPER